MTISFQYKKKPSLIEAVKNDLSLEILDHSSELLEKTEYTEEYVLYCACKYEDNITAVVSLITYNSFNKECFVKVMDESVNPYYYGISKSVFNKLTPIENNKYISGSYAKDWRSKVNSVLSIAA
jgi:hypothetical protein